ncbi:hypothetical protein Moror_11824 [Moniliophthora roreri MCA 2997]|nr:hypothetical protein Moror_11824 [Moniliophthora roreri MCA 2997]
MVLALLTPELIVLWAARQWYSANRIARKFKRYGWGKSHAFFILMGGFALYDGEKFCGYLWEKREEVDEEYWDQIVSLHQRESSGLSPHSSNLADQENDNQAEFATLDANQAHQVIDLEVQSVEGSEDQKSSDPACLLEFFITKGYITITEDEIKDNLSHGDVISKSVAIIQTTWFLLQVIARAAEGLAITELEIVTVAFALLSFATYFLWWNKPLRIRHPIRVDWRRHELTSSNKLDEASGGWVNTMREGVAAILNYTTPSQARNTPDFIAQIIMFPITAIVHFINLASAITNENTAENIPKVLLSARLGKKGPLRLYIPIYCIACVFGGIHCIAWAFRFPTHTDQVLWRISSVIVAIVPFTLGVLHWYLKSIARNISRFVSFLLVTPAMLLGILYMVARAILIVVALSALRDLPPSAYQTVRWTTFIPHIG